LLSRFRSFSPCFCLKSDQSSFFSCPFYLFKGSLGAGRYHLFSAPPDFPLYKPFVSPHPLPPFFPPFFVRGWMPLAVLANVLFSFSRLGCFLFPLPSPVLTFLDAHLTKFHLSLIFFFFFFFFWTVCFGRSKCPVCSYPPPSSFCRRASPTVCCSWYLPPQHC